MRRADAAALAYLQGLSRFGMRLGLERMRWLLQRLGSPQEAFAVVHVAGTNGKGSTAAMLAAMARAAGLRVGLYTSPHLLRFHERIVVDGRPISPEELAEAFEAVREAVEAQGEPPAPTHFEFTTAMAFWHMARAGVELAVVEVGLGGRLDATNVVRPCLCILTPIGPDHTQVLGDTLAQIAAEKAGIVKAGVPVVTAPQPGEAMEVIVRRCRELGSPLYRVGEPGEPDGASAPYRFRVLEVSLTGGQLTVEGPGGWRLEAARVALAGRHQLLNAATALAAAHRLAEAGWPLAEAALREGLASVRWPARLQVLGQRPWLVLDGAHNPPAAQALASAVQELFGRPAPVLVVGMLAEKDTAGVLRALVHRGAFVVSTRSRSARTEPAAPEALARLALDLGAGRAVAVTPAARAVATGVAAARALGSEGPVVVAGSLYLAAEVLAALEAAGIDMERQ